MNPEFLNHITMYRLVMYFLIILVLAAAIFSFFGLVPFRSLNIIFSAALLTVSCWLVNVAFAKVFQVSINPESSYITALILALIITPIQTFNQLPFFLAVCFLAIASKYLLAINCQHIFNPAALGVFLAGITLKNAASWWIGNAQMVALVVIGGILVAQKIKNRDLVWAFLITSLSIFFGQALYQGQDLLLLAKTILASSPIFFFAFIMLTEPQTTPLGRTNRIIYGVLVGLLYALPWHIKNFYGVPEMALLMGNLFSSVASPKEKIILHLKKKTRIAKDTYDFVFDGPKARYQPGQYMEWTLKHQNPDARGVRRYFSLASSPTEENIRIATKFLPNHSSFKKALLQMRPPDQIVASELSGDFVLPKNKAQKLVFMAGGIGITPFRSMVKYLLDTKEIRDTILMYSNKSREDIAYSDIFAQASKQLKMKIVSVLTDKEAVPADWKGRVGYIDGRTIQEEVPDYQERVFYISGPHSLVENFEKLLREMGLQNSQIKLDYFPGYT